MANLGLSGKVLSEQVTGKVQRSYTYSPWGKRLAMVEHQDSGDTQTSFYGYTPHQDVGVLTTKDGATRDQRRGRVEAGNVAQRLVQQ